MKNIIARVFALTLCAAMVCALPAFAVEEETEAEEEAAPAEEGNPFAEEEPALEATRRINLSELKFGRNYGKD